MATLRVVAYVNQFFGQLGGEEKAGVGPQSCPGAVGAARALQQALGDAGTVVATLNSNGVALDGSVTLTSLSPPTGTFDLFVSGASVSGGVVQGRFEAVPCSR